VNWQRRAAGEAESVGEEGGVGDGEGRERKGGWGGEWWGSGEGRWEQSRVW